MSKRELLFSVTLKDCEVQEFRAGGPGGQKQNKTSSGIRVIHHPSGARGESREQRSQLQNKKAAFTRMTETNKFKIWLNREIAVRDGLPTPEERVAEDMQPEKLRFEVKQDGKWVEG